MEVFLIVNRSWRCAKISVLFRSSVGLIIVDVLSFQPKLFALELMEMIASHLMLKDKEYFGLSYKEDA